MQSFPNQSECLLNVNSGEDTGHQHSVCFQSLERKSVDNLNLGPGFMGSVQD